MQNIELNQNYIEDKFFKEFKDKQLLKELSKHGGYVAGGCFTSLATNKDINDFDIYFKDSDSLFNAVQYMQDEQYHCAFISDKSITFVKAWGELKLTYQFIYYNYYINVSEIFDEYDFTVNMCGYDAKSDKFYCHPQFLLHNAQRHLSVNTGTRFPILSALRIQKYKERDYKINKSDFLKLMFAINKTPIDTWDEFIGQVGGWYGFNHIDIEQLKGESDFSLDLAIDLISNTDFDVDPPVHELCSVPYECIPYIVSKKPVRTVVDKDGNKLFSELNEFYTGDHLNLINTVEVSLKEYLGDYVYKWVNKDMSAPYKSGFKYSVGDWVEARNDFGYDGRLYVSNEVLTSYANNSRTLLVCEYCEDDYIKPPFGNALTFSKVKPIRVLSYDEAVKEFG